MRRDLEKLRHVISRKVDQFAEGIPTATGVVAADSPEIFTTLDPDDAWPGFAFPHSKIRSAGLSRDHVDLVADSK